MVVQDPPNFLVASDFSKHIKPVAVVPDPEPEADADNDSVDNLIDTALPDVSLLDFACLWVSREGGGGGRWGTLHQNLRQMPTTIQWKTSLTHTTWCKSSGLCVSESAGMEWGMGTMLHQRGLCCVSDSVVNLMDTALPVFWALCVCV